MEVPEARIAAFGRDQDASFIRRFPQLDDVKMAYDGLVIYVVTNSVPALASLKPVVFGLLSKWSWDSQRHFGRDWRG